MWCRLIGNGLVSPAVDAGQAYARRPAVAFDGHGSGGTCHAEFKVGAGGDGLRSGITLRIPDTAQQIGQHIGVDSLHRP